MPSSFAPLFNNKICIMKLLTFILFFSLSFSMISQQNQSGIIRYEEAIKLNIDLGDEHPDMAQLLPSSQSVKKVLYYSEVESTYKNDATPEDINIQKNESGKDMQIMFKIPETVIYMHRKNNVFLQSQDLMGKLFLISDKVAEHTWKIIGEQKTILGFVCQKAVLADSSKHLVAWFTHQIPSKMGPDGMTGLPGMILALDYDNGQKMVVASSIEALAPDHIFEKPNKGKKLTRLEFNKIRDEKLKEMGAIHGKGPGVKMIIREERE